MKTNLAYLIFAALLIITLGSCDGFNTAGQEIAIDGAAVKGPIQNGVVTAYQLNADGTPGLQLATANTAADGTFQLQIKAEYADSAVIVVTGGTYVDEATGETVEMGENELSACVAAFTGNENVAVTPLTTMAAQQIRTKAQEGGGSATAAEIKAMVAASNKNVAEAFGLTDVDITTVIPADLSSTQSQTKTAAQQQYGAILAGLCQAAKEGGMAPEEVLTIVNAMADDLEDGEIDGLDGDGEAVDGDAAVVTTQNLYQNMNQHINAFMNGEQNKSGKTSEDTLVTVPEPGSTSESDAGGEGSETGSEGTAQGPSAGSGTPAA